MSTTQVTTSVIADGAVTAAKAGDSLVSGQATVTVAPDDVVLIGDTSDNGKPKKVSAQEVANLAPSKVMQMVSLQTGAVASGVNAIPADNTIPQNTEGDEYMQLAITPTDAANTLVVEVVAFLGHTTAGGTFVGALFRDAVADALAAGQMSSAGSMNPFTFKHIMAAGGTSEIIFKFRAGEAGGATTYFNSSNGMPTGMFGGVVASSITVTEYKA
ncbi:hypothetical protein [Magnetovibrio sp.]|uniref:hypothetical protein n=1 Tax=Magnetovibrio sp. TaxID=2024836 RepID=UPI002F91E43B